VALVATRRMLNPDYLVRDQKIPLSGLKNADYLPANLKPVRASPNPAQRVSPC
jgi:hypothetical protein